MKLFDLHCDTLYEALIKNKSLIKNDLHLSVQRGEHYHPWVQCFAVWIPDTVRGGEAMKLFDDARRKLQKEKGPLRLCRTPDDLRAVEEGNAWGAMLTVEGGAVLGGELSNLCHLHRCGVRMMTLTWNGQNEIGGGAGVKNNAGITAFGREVVEKMEELSMVVDVSHASDRLFYDVAEIARKPFCATHSNARAVCAHQRNLTDEQFSIIKERGGVVGLNFYPPFLREDNKGGVTDLLRHAEHFLSLGGEETLCLGSDFDGAYMPPEITGIESMADLYEAFLKAGYQETLVNALFFDNASRFFHEML